MRYNDAGVTAGPGRTELAKILGVEMTTTSEGNLQDDRTLWHSPTQLMEAHSTHTLNSLPFDLEDD